MELGQRLKLEMKKRGVTSAELAKRAGVKTSFIYDVISGKSSNPSTLKLSKVTTALGITLGSLIGDGAEEDLFSRLRLRVSSNGGKLFTVIGDSMQPSFYPNDVLLYDITQRTLSSPGFFVVNDGMGLSVKRLEYTEHKIRVTSDNPHYSTYEKSPDEVIIMGRVVWFSREI